MEVACANSFAVIPHIFRLVAACVSSLHVCTLFLCTTTNSPAFFIPQQQSKATRARPVLQQQHPAAPTATPIPRQVKPQVVRMPQHQHPVVQETLLPLLRPALAVTTSSQRRAWVSHRAGASRQAWGSRQGLAAIPQGSPQVSFFC